LITQERLKELLKYDPLTGVFTWRVNLNNRSRRGQEAGYRDEKGYTLINIYGRRYKAHRLAFLYMEDKMPKMVDHDNRIRSDNVWSNLNPSNPFHNSSNAHNNNIHVGVGRIRDKWRAYAKGHHIGVFKTHLAACMARHNWEVYHQQSFI